MSRTYLPVEDSNVGRKEKQLTWPLLLALSASTLGSSFVFGYNVGVINAPAELIKEWIRNESYPSLHHSTPNEYVIQEIWCWIVAVFSLSGTLGGLAVGYLADKLGRKGAMMANDALVLAGALFLGISKMTNGYVLLIVGRAILGISCGICSALPPMYLTEIAPLKLRGILASMNTLVVIVGIFISQIVGQPQLLGTENMWPLLLACTGVPVVFHLLTMPFCVESPKYLLLIKKKPEEAREALAKLRQKEDVSEEMKAMQDEGGQIRGESVRSSSGSFWWGMSICLVHHISQQFSGINAVLFFSAIIFRDQAKMTIDQSVGATLGIGAVFILSSIVSTAIIDRLGRRVLMLSGVAGTFLFNILIFVSLHLLAIDGQKYQPAAYCAVICVYLFIFTFGLGPSSVPWFYTSELFDPVRRGRANMIATTVNWLCGFIVSYTFLPLKGMMNEYVFLIYAGVMAAGFVFLFFYAPETKGRESREVAKELEARKPRWIR